MKMYHKYVNEFVLGQGYVQQPPVVMSEEEVNAEIEAQGGQKYQNVFYVEVAAEQCVETDEGDEYDFTDPDQNPWLLSGQELERTIALRSSR